jgi:hypothetical protein
MPSIVVTLDGDSQRVVNAGREAWQSLKADETFEKWVSIGRAIEIGRTEIMRLLHTNRPAGAVWSRTFGDWLHENGFDEIDKGARSRLQNVIDNLPSIEAWRQQMGLAQRLRLNHPTVVWQRWQAAQAAPKAPGDPSAPTPGNRKDAEIVRLQEELDAAQREIAQLKRGRENVTEGRDWTWHDQVDDIARAMFASHPDKAKRLGSALQRLAQSTTPKPRGRTPA